MPYRHIDLADVSELGAVRVRDEKTTADPSTPQVQKAAPASLRMTDPYISQAFTSFLYVDTSLYLFRFGEKIFTAE
jgi:hypothetical protein